MLRTSIAALFILSILRGPSAHAQPYPYSKRPAGKAGIVFGGPTGLELRFSADRSNHLFWNLGVTGTSLVAVGGWEHALPEKKRRYVWDIYPLDFFAGVGVHAHLNGKERFGLGPLAGAQLRFGEESPFSAFARILPFVRVQPSAGFNLDLALGLLFNF